MSSNLSTSNSFWSNLFKTPSEKTDLEDVIKSMPPFENLNSRYIKLLLNIVHYRTYQQNEFIFKQGDPGIGLYIVREGSVKIIRTEENGTEREIAHFNRGDFFGDMAMLEGEVRSASAIADEETNVAVIFRPELDEFVDRHPEKGIEILRGISQILASRLRILNKDYAELQKTFYEINEEPQNGYDSKDISTD